MGADRIKAMKIFRREVGLWPIQSLYDIRFNCRMILKAGETVVATDRFGDQMWIPRENLSNDVFDEIPYMLALRKDMWRYA